MLSYTTPLRNPLGPRQAVNREVMEAALLGPDSFVVRTRCVTAGVPFSANFANYVQWVASAEGPGATRLSVSGGCKFHAPVWGPVRGQIERESAKVRGVGWRGGLDGGLAWCVLRGEGGGGLACWLAWACVPPEALLLRLLSSAACGGGSRVRRAAAWGGREGRPVPLCSCCRGL